MKAAVGEVNALSAEQKASVIAKADGVLQIIEAEPKSGKWKRRAEVGTKKPWYTEVLDWD